MRDSHASIECTRDARRMTTALKRVDYVQFEMSDTWLAQQGCSNHVLLGILQANGFSIPSNYYNKKSHYGVNMIVRKTHAPN